MFPPEPLKTYDDLQGQKKKLKASLDEVLKVSTDYGTKIGAHQDALEKIAAKDQESIHKANVELRKYAADADADVTNITTSRSVTAGKVGRVTPYTITLDLNNDGAARDFFYRNAAVSEDPQHPDRGLHGLLKNSDSKGNTVFEANRPVMVWSPGPDKMINPEKKANEGVNKDNLLSWK